MNNKEIQELLLKYRQGKCSEEETGQIHKWYDSLNSASPLSLDEREKQLLEGKLLKNIRQEIFEPERNLHEVLVKQMWWKSYYFHGGIAAALVIALSSLLFFNKTEKTKIYTPETVLVQAVGSELITTENETGDTKRIVLEDKSVIVLSPGSRIIYPEKFADDIREVQLIGNAFFEITKNPGKPFLVYSGKLITRVLGTSFRIKTNDKDKALEVEVVTGKVSVFENNNAFANENSALDSKGKSSNGVVLTPNQRVTYFPESRHLMTGLVVEPVEVQVLEVKPKMVFNDVLLLEIVNTLQKEYGIEIVFANDRLEKCTFTGDLSEMPLYEKLELICKSNQADYEVKGTRILINGEGCN